MANETVLRVRVVGDSRDVERALKRSEKAATVFGKESEKASKRAGSAFAGVGRAARTAIPLVGAGLGGAVAFAVSNFAEGQKVAAQTNAVIKSTGGAAKVTAKEVNALAGSIARQTGQSDEAIQAGQNLLLTFTKVRNEAGKGNKIFDRATVAISDMSQALGQSTTASAVQLGKALNDPVKGVTALQRVGVSFTKQQKEQITTLAESGKALEAQKIILREIETQFGGSANAYGRTLAGSVDRAKNAVGDLSEALGAALAPTITAGAQKLQVFVNQMEDGTGAGGRFVTTVKNVGTTLGEIGGRAVEVGRVGIEFARSTEGVTVLSAALGGLAGRFVGLGVAAVVAQLGTMVAALKGAGGAMAALNAAIARNPIGLAATVIGTAVGALIGFSTASRDAKTSQDDLANAVDRYRDAMRRVNDLDLEAAQRKANLKSANAQLTTAEKELAAARASGDPTRIKQAEAGLAQAKVQVARASREVKRTQEDETRARRDGKVATEEAVKTARDRISTLNRERTGTRENIRNLKETIEVMRRDGASRKELAPVVARLEAAKRKDAAASRAIADEMRRIPKNVRSQVSVRFSLSGVADFAKDAADAITNAFENPSGDGPGRAINQAFGSAVAFGRERASGAVGAAFKREYGDGPGRVPAAGAPSSSLMGANSALRPFANVGASYGLRVSDGKRPGGTRTSSGGVSFHSTGEAVDLAGPPAGMMRTFRALKSRFGPQLAELIYTPGGVGIKHGRPYTYTGKVAADHIDHVHVAVDLGRPGIGIGDGPGRLSLGQMKGLAASAGVPAGEQSVAAAIAMGESGGNPRANLVTSREDSRGLWQINTYAHPWSRSMDLYDPRQNAKAMARVSGRGRNWRPWTVFTSGKYRQFLSGAQSARPTTTGSGGSTRVRRPTKPFASQLPSQPAAETVFGAGTGGLTTPADTGRFEDTSSSSGAVAPEIAAGPSPEEIAGRAWEALDARLAVAQLTAGTGDDLAVLEEMRASAESWLQGSQAAGNNVGVREAATTLKSILTQIEGLRQDAAAQAEQTNAVLLELTRAELEKAQAAARLSQMQYAPLFQALGDIVNGQIGGRVGLGFQTPGFAGGGVRY